MTDYFDLETARERYKHEPSEVLIRIAFVPQSSYRPEAVQLACDELATRGIDREDHALVVATRAVVKAEESAAADTETAPLGTAYKVTCFLLADVVGAVIAIAHFATGRKRASIEAFKWMGFGWLARFAVLFLVILFNPSH